MYVFLKDLTLILGIDEDLINKLEADGKIETSLNDFNQKTYKLDSVLNEVKLIETKKVEFFKRAREKELHEEEKKLKAKKRLEIREKIRKERKQQGINNDSDSRLKFFHAEIVELLKKGLSMRKVWQIINGKLPEALKMRYNPFVVYVKKHIRNDDDKK